MSTWNNSKKTLQETDYVSPLSQMPKSLLPTTVKKKKMQTGEKNTQPKGDELETQATLQGATQSLETLRLTFHRDLLPYFSSVHSVSF